MKYGISGKDSGYFERVETELLEQGHASSIGKVPPERVNPYKPPTEKIELKISRKEKQTRIGKIRRVHKLGKAKEKMSLRHIVLEE